MLNYFLEEALKVAKIVFLEVQEAVSLLDFRNSSVVDCFNIKLNCYFTISHIISLK